MSEMEIVQDVLHSILAAAERISQKFRAIQDPGDFFTAEQNRDALDVICMQLTAIGEALKQVDRLTRGSLLANYSKVDWKGLKGIRDVIVHQYFDISAEAVFETCKNDIPALQETINIIIKELDQA